MSGEIYAIQVRNLKKSYGGNTVLKGVDLDIRRGEIFALLGINGAGKTTALECIEGLRKYEDGEVTVNGSVGVQLQSSSLPGHIRAAEAIKLFAVWNETRNKARGKAPYRAKPFCAGNFVFEAIGADEFKKKQYSELSTGQKRRLHLALALIADPDIIFLDEPTAGLDVENRLSLHNFIRELKTRGKTVVLASHDMAEIEALCDRIAVLNDGRIEFCGEVSELTDKTGRKYFIHVKTEQGDRNIETGNIEDTLLSLLGELKDKGIRVLDIKVDRGSLEQHFIELTGRKK